MSVYDLSWLRAEAKRAYPDDVGLLIALAGAGQPISIGEAYVSFVSAANANQPGSDWQLERSVALEETSRGFVVIDLLRDGRLGGIEFPDKVCA